MFKGLVFIALTASLLYVLIARYIRRINVHTSELSLAQQTLARQKMLLDIVVEGTTDAIYIKDAAGRYILANSAVAGIVKKPVEEIIGQDDRHLIPPDEAQALMAQDQWVMSQTGPQTYEERLTTSDGNRYFLSTKGPVLDVDGTVSGIFGIARDITQRKQMEIYGEIGREILQILNEPGTLQESIQRFLTVIKTRTGFDAVGIRLQDGKDFAYFAQEGFSNDVLLTENSLIMPTANEGMCRDKDGSVSLECTCGLVISGKTEPASPLFTAGGSFWTNDSSSLLTSHADEDPRPNPRNNCIHEGFASFALVPIRNKDRVVGLIQFNNKRKGCFTQYTVELLEGIASHIGEAMMRKRAEEEIHKKDAEIEQFIYTVSHDLRSPLVTVKTFMGFLEKDMAEGNKEQIAQDIQFIHSAADKMKLLLDELLEMSRIGRVETPPVRLSLKDMLAEALDGLAGDIIEQKVDIQLPESDLMFFGDRPRLCQIWQNLIENAIKYSREGSIARIELGVRQMSGETVFFVKDNGIGINPQYHTKIFGIFDKLDPKSPGAGLGLSMVQRIVEKCGGSVWVESEGPNKGSCFCFTLPHAVEQI